MNRKFLPFGPYVSCLSWALIGSTSVLAWAVAQSVSPSTVQDLKNSSESVSAEASTPSAVRDEATSATAAAASESRPDTLGSLFQKAFSGRRRQGVQSLKLQSHLTIDGLKAGSIFVLTKQGATDSSAETLIDAHSFNENAKDFIVPHVLESLKARANTLGYLRNSDFTEAGLQMRFDSYSLKTEIVVPTELRIVAQDSVRSRRPKTYGQPLRPSKVSAVLNMALARTYQHNPAHSQWQPFTADFRGALNIQTFVLEGDFVYRQGNAKPWQRNDVRLVKDFPSLALRTSLGDLRYNVQGFQSSPMLGGLSFARNFSLRPYETVQSSGDAMFVLTSPSRVEFFVNGQLVETQSNVATGPHRISDFPLGSGANDIEVRITDAYGRVETKSFPFFFSNEVLERGVNDFSYNIGYLTNVDDQGIRHYDTHTPTFSMAHRLGLTSAMTVGANFQGNTNQSLIGGEIDVASILGSVSVNTAFSRAGKTTKRTGQAVTVGYSFTPQNSLYKQSFSLQWHRKSLAFTALKPVDPNFDVFTNSISNSFSGRYSQNIIGDIAATLSGTYDLWNNGKRGNSQTLSFSKSLAFGPYLSLSLSRTLTPDIFALNPSQQDKRLLVGLTWSLGQSGHTVAADFDSSTHAFRSRWNYNNGSGAGSFNASASVGKDPNTTGAEGQITYTGNRFVTSVAHNLSSPKDSSSSSTTTLRAETALVFADGHTALSRPVYDSFVMVAPVKALKQHPMKVNPNGKDGYVAKADMLGAAVVPNTTSYYVQNIQLDRSNLPTGTQITNEAYYIEAPYKSGAVIEVGTDAVVIVRGQLLDGTGQPLGLSAVEITSIDDAGTPPIVGFTNRKGRFSIEGLKAGQFKLRVLSDEIYATTLTIPEETKGVYNLEQITPEKE